MTKRYLPDMLSVWFIRRDGWAKRIRVDLPLAPVVEVAQEMDLAKFAKFPTELPGEGDQPVRTMQFSLQRAQAPFPWSEDFFYQEV